MSARPPVPGAATPRPVKVLTLGQFAVLVGGKPLRFGRKAPVRPLALLKYLASQGGAVADVQAAAALWPGDEGAALRSLAVNVHRLRLLLSGGAALVYQERRLAFDSRIVWCDALAFERLLDHADGIASNEESIRYMQRALALYGGDFLAHEEAQPWMEAMRTRLRARFLTACSILGQRLCAARRWPEARACYDRGLTIDALAEDLCLGLMNCLAALHEPVAGVAAYRRFERSLAASPGSRPASATAALYRRLLRQRS